MFFGTKLFAITVIVTLFFEVISLDDAY